MSRQFYIACVWNYHLCLPPSLKHIHFISLSSPPDALFLPCLLYFFSFSLPQMSLMEHGGVRPITAVAWTSNTSTCPKDHTLVGTEIKIKGFYNCPYTKIYCCHWSNNIYSCICRWASLNCKQLTDYFWRLRQMNLRSWCNLTVEGKAQTSRTVWVF